MNWNELTNNEKMNEVRTLNETYVFAQYSDAETAAYNVRLGIENNPEWFDFDVSNLDDFEGELSELVKEYTRRLEIADERVYAYGYGNEEFCGADIESIMQDYVDEKEPDTWEVGQAEYFEDENCWSAKLNFIGEL